MPTTPKTSKVDMFMAENKPNVKRNTKAMITPITTPTGLNEDMPMKTATMINAINAPTALLK